MEHYGYLSILPPILAIIIALKTREVYSSLLVGIFSGAIILSNFNLIESFIKTISIITNVFSDAGNTRTIIFSSLIGALLILIQSSGGVDGFVRWSDSKLSTLKKSKSLDQKIILQLAAIFTGTIIFIETNISLLTTGTIFRPLFDKFKISREKLAYIADSSSAPISVLIPFNAWGAYIASLIAAEGISSPFGTMLSVIPFNFYPLFALSLLLLTTIFSKELGKMKKAKDRIEKKGKLFDEGSHPAVNKDITSYKIPPNIKKRSYNMIIPIVIMIVSMPLFLIYDGWEKSLFALPFFTSLKEAISSGSGSKAVLNAVVLSIICSAILFKVQKIFTLKKSITLIVDGMSGMLPLALLMLLAFAIGGICKELNTGIYVSELAQKWLTPSLLPVIAFIISAFISFSTGTSWGTFAIMIPIAFPTAVSMGIDIHLALGAVLSGGVFGDHCSPISDTTIVASMASACDHIDHVKTQLPYALISALFAALAFYII